MVVVVVVLAAVAGWLYLRREGGSQPVALRSAVAAYRAAQAGAAAAGVPAPGVYAYAVHGWECAGIGPICLHRTLPRTGYLIVTRRGDLLTVEVDLSAQHQETQRYRVTAAGRLLTWQRTRISILGVTQVDASAARPATTLALPGRLRAGERWRQRFSTGNLPVTTLNRVTGGSGVPVGGRTYPVWVIASSSVTGGPHPGTERDVAWHSAVLGLDLRFTIDRRITGAFPYRLVLSARLMSVHPAR